MQERLQKLEQEYVEIEQKLIDPGIIGNQKEYQILMRRHKELSKIVSLFRDMKNMEK